MQTQDKIPSAEQLVTMFNTTTQKGRVILILGIHGLRVGEIISLRISDLMLDDKIPHIRIRNEVAKNHKGRLVPLTPQAVEVLKAYLVVKKDQSPSLVNVHADRIIKYLHRLLEKCKLTDRDASTNR